MTTTPRTLTLSADAFDLAAIFTLAHPRAGRLPMRATLQRNKNTKDDGIYWALQRSATVSASYTPEEAATLERLRNEAPIQNGEIVLIEGEEYRTRIAGDYSDCAVFDKV